MNRRNRTLLVLMVAVGLASAASYGVFRMIQNIPVREVEVATVHVAVAAENLPLGTRLTRDHVKLVGWPASSPLVGGFDSIDAILGRGLVQPVGANEPLTETKLAPVEAGAGLPPSIPPGMRALSVRVNDVIGVAGFTVPGTRVDVLVTLQQQNNESLSRTVVSNLQVLTAGTRYDQEAAKDGQPLPSTVVTLLVTPDDAERITLAQSAGSIMLVLRNPLDVLPSETRGARMANLTGAPAPPPVVRTVQGQRRVVAAAPAEPAPAPRIYSVETIRAAQRKEEVVR
jgi:pilus assembly protein CpaB